MLKTVWGSSCNAGGRIELVIWVFGLFDQTPGRLAGIVSLACKWNVAFEQGWTPEIKPAASKRDENILELSQIRAVCRAIAGLSWDNNQLNNIGMVWAAVQQNNRQPNFRIGHLRFLAAKRD